MRLLYDLHTHTDFSHGKGTVRDNIERACEIGLEKIGISDHAPGHCLYGVRRMEQYLRSVEEIKKEFHDRISVVAAMEFNLLDLSGGSDYNDEIAKCLDMCFCGYHKMALSHHAGSFMYFVFSGAKDVCKNTGTYISLLEKHDFYMITHPGYCLKLDVKEFARSCRDTDTFIEINEKHNDLSPEDLYVMASEGARFVVSSDAHSPRDIGKVTKALYAVEKAGIISAVVNVCDRGKMI